MFQQAHYSSDGLASLVLGYRGDLYPDRGQSNAEDGIPLYGLAQARQETTAEREELMKWSHWRAFHSLIRKRNSQERRTISKKVTKFELVLYFIEESHSTQHGAHSSLLVVDLSGLQVTESPGEAGTAQELVF